MQSARQGLVVLLFANALATFAYSIPPRTAVNYSYNLKTITRSDDGFVFIDKSIGGSLGGGEGNLGNKPITRSVGDVLIADTATATATVLLSTTGAIGGLHVTLLGIGNAEDFDRASVTASAEASWLDDLKLTVPFSTGLGFSNLFVNAFLNVHGDMSVEGNGFVSLSIRDTDDVINTLPPSPLQSGGFSSSTWGFVQKAGNDIRLLPPEQIPVRIGIFLGGFDAEKGVVFGTRSVGYIFKLDLTANGSGAVSARSQGEYGNTVSWGGITSVETSAGVPVTNYVLSSESGFDYSQPYVVPEPSGIQLLAALVGASIVFWRRLRIGS